MWKTNYSTIKSKAVILRGSEKCRKYSADKAYRIFSSVTMVHSSACVDLNNLQKNMDLSILHHPVPCGTLVFRNERDGAS